MRMWKWLVVVGGVALAALPFVTCKHRPEDTHLEARDGNLYLRCRRCGRRSPGIMTGGMR